MNIESRLQGLSEYADRAGYHWRGGDTTVTPSVLFGLMSGDPDFICFTEDGTLVVRKAERGQISPPMIATSDLDEIDRYLSFKLGNEVRARAGMERLSFNLDPAISLGAHSGMEVELAEHGLSVSWLNDGSRVNVKSLSSLDASRFLLYAQLSAQQIRDSFLRPDGGFLGVQRLV